MRANYRSLKSLKPYAIPFTGLKLGKHQFDFDITDAFFNEFEYSLVKKGKLKCLVELDKQETMLVLHFDITGSIDLSCDRCLADYPQQVDITEQQIAKFSEEEIEDEDIITITKNDHEINVAPLIYEYITVAVPFVAVCTDEGRTQYCDNDMLDKLEKLAGGGEEPDDDEQDDPTWDALKKIK